MGVVCECKVKPFMGVRGVLLPLLAADVKAESAVEEGPAEGCRLEAALSCRAVGAAEGLEVVAGSCLLSCLLARLYRGHMLDFILCTCALICLYAHVCVHILHMFTHVVNHIVYSMHDGCLCKAHVYAKIIRRMDLLSYNMNMQHLTRTGHVYAVITAQWCHCPLLLWDIIGMPCSARYALRDLKTNEMQGSKHGN